MANEDCRENSVMSGALKLAAVGATAYGVYRGGRGLIKNYDDLGSTMLSGVGDKMSTGIKKGISKLDGPDRTKIKDTLDTVQTKILDRDYEQAFKKGTKAFSEANPNLENASDLRSKAYKSSHESFKNKSVADKRSAIQTENDFRKGLTKKL